MASIDEIRNARLAKLELLKKRGIDPYPANVRRDVSCREAKENFEALQKKGKSLYMTGRLLSLREQGKIIFLDFYDGTEKFQAFLKKGDPLSDESFELFQDAFDIGDFVEIKGILFVTRQGEKSIQVEDIRMIAKSLRPLPEKWHGLQDQETRFRHRYLDFIFNPEIRELFVLREKFWQSIRSFLDKEGFLEVETPTLEVTTGGAEARPFKTHHNDFDLDVFLRISVGELWQKRLMAGGFNKTFEIGRVYRNEGSSPEHVQEFTNIEFYASYLNFEEGKELVKNLYRHIAEEVFGRTEFETRGHKFNLADDWQELDYVETIEKMTGINVIEDSEDKLELKLKELGVKYEGNNRERMTDSLWKYCRKSISGPAFLINHPKLVAPLSKTDPGNPELTKTFQVILAGSEIGRAHAELNDPLEQEDRFNRQKKMIESGDEEAMMPDEGFVDMLEYGMPPTFGFGFGERLFAFMVDKPIREIQMFPLMKPRD